MITSVNHSLVPCCPPFFVESEINVTSQSRVTVCLELISRDLVHQVLNFKKVDTELKVQFLRELPYFEVKNFFSLWYGLLS